jgi:hypothetical protein
LYDTIPEPIASHKTQQICVAPCPRVQPDQHPCWAGRKIENFIFIQKYDSSERKMEYVREKGDELILLF